MNQYFKLVVIGFMIIGLFALSGLSVSAVAQNQSGDNQTSGSSNNMTAGGGGNMTLQEEGSSGINKTVARNQSAGGGGSAPS